MKELFEFSVREKTSVGRYCRHISGGVISRLFLYSTCSGLSVCLPLRNPRFANAHTRAGSVAYTLEVKTAPLAARGSPVGFRVMITGGSSWKSSYLTALLSLLKLDPCLLPGVPRLLDQSYCPK